ncbi:MAG: serine protease [Polyangiaceae bacterium]|nr:serine protease [Polyangiaceae bacterium]
MSTIEGAHVGATIRSYTAGVMLRRLIGAAGVAAIAAVATSAFADPPRPAQSATSNADATRAANQAARAIAAATDPAVDGEVAPDQNENPLDRARMGVVVLERNGKPVGVGAVLRGDGRVLTALSPLGNGNDVDARFADGSVSRVRVGHTDRAWDLALLVPQNGRWQDGLKASRRSATGEGSNLRAFSLAGSKLVLTRTIVKGERSLVGGDSEVLRDALEMASRFKDSDVGSPIVDSNGDVVAVVARACAPAPDGSCVTVPYGVPVSAIKAFLRTAPASAVPPAPWLGIQGVAKDTGVVRGVEVLSVHPQSPAAAAGLKGTEGTTKGDLVVAVDGRPVITPEVLATEVNGRAVGASVNVLLFGDGKFRQVTLTLRPTPTGRPATPTPKAIAPRTPPSRK